MDNKNPKGRKMKKRYITPIIIAITMAIIVLAGPSESDYTWQGRWQKAAGVGAEGINTVITVKNTGTHNCDCKTNVTIISESDGGWVDETVDLEFAYSNCEHCDTYDCQNFTKAGCLDCSTYNGSCWEDLPPGCQGSCMGMFPYCSSNADGYNETGESCRYDLATGQTTWANTTNASVLGCYENGTSTTIGETQTTFGTFILQCAGIDYPPNITLIAPQNDSVNDTSYNITFYFNASDESAVENCTLMINGTKNATTTNVPNFALSNITTWLFNGDYLWEINCTDEGGHQNNSDTWIIHMNVSNSPPYLTTETDEGSTATNPTNINTNVTFQATASDTDQDTYQLVICDSSTISQSGVCGGTQICASGFVNPGTQTSCSHNTTGEMAASYPWWSFVCDGENCSDYNATNSPYYVNHFPTSINVPNITWAEEGFNDSLNISQYFTDPDGNDLNYTSTKPTNIIIEINNDTGIVNLTSTANFTGERTIIFTAYDQYGLKNTSNTVTLNITNTNDAPYFDPSLENQTITEGTELKYDINATDIDPYDILSYYDNATEFEINKTTGYINWTPGNDDTGILTVNVTVCDDSNAADNCTWGTFNITITATNDPPIFNNSNPIQNISWPEDTKYTSLNLTPHFYDPDSTDLNYSYTPVSNIQIAIDQETGMVNLTPDANFTGERTIQFNATDGSLWSGYSNVIMLNVTPVNDAPYMTSVGLNVTTGKKGTHIRATTTGAGDIDSAQYYLQCGTATGIYDLCSGSLGAGERTCDFTTPWTDDAAHTVYCSLNDTETNSGDATAIFTADNTAPGTNTINNLEDDPTPKYWDTDNDGHTVVQLDLTETNMKCRWNETDLNYTEMIPEGECTIGGTTASCELNVTTQINETIRYVSCQDQYGNDQNNTQNTDILFGVDWTNASVNSNNDGQIHIPGYQVTLTINDEPAGTTVTVMHCNDTTGTCGPTQKYTGTNGTQKIFTFNNRGIYHLRWNASDEAGNINETKQTIIFINTLTEIQDQVYANLTGHRFLVNATVYDNVGASQGGSYQCWLYHKTGANPYTTKPMQLIAGSATDGIYTGNLSTTDGYSVFDTIDTYVNCTDGLEWNVSSYGNNTIPNTIPTAPTVDVVPNNPNTNDDLYCNISTNSTDADLDTVSYLYDWYKDGTPQDIHTDTVASGLTANGETWNCTATPNDGYENGTKDSDIVTVGNSAPEFNNSNLIANITWAEDTTDNSLDLDNHFHDPDGDPLTYQNTTIANISVVIAGNGIVTFTPDANFTGTRTIQFNATDGSLWSGYSNIVTLNVTNMNDPPYFDPPLTGQTAYETQPFLYDINATDIDAGDTLNFTTNSTLFVINETTGIINFTPVTTGTHDINVTVCDDKGGCASDIFILDIQNYVNQVNFTVKDRIHQLQLMNLTITGGTTCAAGCGFNKSIILNEPTGPANYTIQKYGFTTNLTTLNVTGDTNINVELDDNMTPKISFIELIPELVGENESYNIKIAFNATDNYNLTQGIWRYNLSRSTDLAGTKILTKTGTELNGTIKNITASYVYLNSTIEINDSYGNIAIKELDSWFLFVAGAAVAVNDTMDLNLRQGWNLFSVIEFKNSSIKKILSGLGNGNYGCGHDDMPPFNCVEADGDYAGNWTIVWTQNNAGNWISFRPDIYYTQLDSQELQKLYVGKGYWINMKKAQNITIQND